MTLQRGREMPSINWRRQKATKNGIARLSRVSQRSSAIIFLRDNMSYTNGNGNGHQPKPKNVLGGELKSCCADPMTGFYRDGYCRTSADDTGRHTVCILATDEFLTFSKAAGNDLSTPMPQYAFPGLQD